MSFRDAQRDPKVPFDPTTKVRVEGIENGVQFTTTYGRLDEFEEGLVKIIQDPWLSPKDKKAATAAKAKATKAANKAKKNEE